MHPALAARFDLTGRVALVTGGGRGLGRAAALALGQAGAAVVVAARSPDQLDGVVLDLADHGVDALGLPADLSDPDAAAALVAEAAAWRGRVDIVVHAAGNQERYPALDMPVSSWDRVQSVHLRAGFIVAREAARHMIAVGEGGRIIVIASLASHVGLPHTAAYTAAKGGLSALVRNLAAEWAPEGITVNAISPGYYRTELTEALFEDPERVAWFRAKIPMGRTGEPEELATAVVFLAAPGSGYVTGQDVAVDGGWLAV